MSHRFPGRYETNDERPTCLAVLHRKMACVSRRFSVRIGTVISGDNIGES